VQKITLDDIQKSFKPRNWWDLVINLKITKYLTLLIANYTKITPNQITTLSLVFAIFSGVAFYYEKLVVGAVLYQISYIFDIVDGSLARVKSQSSQIGAFYDVLTDWLKAPILIYILFTETGQRDLYIVILFLLFINCTINKYNDMLYFAKHKSVTKELKSTSSSLIGRYFLYMEKRHIQALPAIVEFEALVLFFYPMFLSNFFIYLAISILFSHFILKILVIFRKVSK
jgi:phosphatidylglycerophosphate synthase